MILEDGGGETGKKKKCEKTASLEIIPAGGDRHKLHSAIRSRGPYGEPQKVVGGVKKKKKKIRGNFG